MSYPYRPARRPAMQGHQQPSAARAPPPQRFAAPLPAMQGHQPPVPKPEADDPYRMYIQGVVASSVRPKAPQPPTPVTQADYIKQFGTTREAMESKLKKLSENENQSAAADVVAINPWGDK